MFCHYAERRALFTIMLIVVMLSVVLHFNQVQNEILLYCLLHMSVFSTFNEQN
jgi:hypothetical protein